MIPYILYAALILTACLVFYKLLLQNETFFKLNRFVLLSCMALAFVLPLLHVPQQFSFRQITTDEITFVPVKQVVSTTVIQKETQAGKSKAAATGESFQKKTGFSFGQVMQWLIYLYWFGVIIFTLNFLMQAILLLYKAYAGQVIKDGPYRIVEITGDKAPCSFGNNIFINPEKYDWETYSQVLLHEKIHIEQRHTIDLLLAEIVLIFQWFNPFAWQWRKELENNLEYFTDNQLLQQSAVEKESYQLSLVKVAAPHFPLSLTTNYNQSLLKKRLIMMNSKKSNVHTIWKYFFLLPVMVLFVCLFNEPAVNSQSIAFKHRPSGETNNQGYTKTEGNWFATIKGDKVSMQFTDKEETNSSNGNTFLLSELNPHPVNKEGTFTITREAGTMNFTGKFDGDKGMGTYKFAPDKAYSLAMEKEGIDVNGGNDAIAFFLINIKTSYVQMLKRQGYNNLDKDKVIPLAALNVNEGYITSIKSSGIKDIDLDNLVTFKALNIDKAYIDEIVKTGYKDLDADKLITFKAQGIDAKYIADFRSTGQLKNNGDGNGQDNDVINNISKNQQKSSKDKDGGDKNEQDDDDLIAFKSLDIDEAYVNSFRQAGYTKISNSDLIAMKSLGVTPEYARSFRTEGFNDIQPEDLVALKSQNITAALVRGYKELGFKNITIENIVGAKATGTTPVFIKLMRDKGHNLKSLDKYIALRAVIGE